MNISFQSVLNDLVTYGYLPQIPTDPNPKGINQGYCAAWSVNGYLYGSGVWLAPVDTTVYPNCAEDRANNSAYALEFCLENIPTNLPGAPLNPTNTSCNEGRYRYLSCLK
ncbi:MAG: hypothetical protein COU81_00705 [Candidatus Portnoybacteria bacterium CG10_big_fil_rev_8_21_14_0_10_36_7]|uniref:Uncharacterized protein n=1 Tax=Candidatus Portnoybacteria bacterium CG10_big_fil_rev_8_21_14_0_10_36_7 TaxID=1974812 RepID=A0A2M8KEW3_9BACT|nr:MAG: hypothetical protein COU81_00705 [Candidatus Portnoybacteria bacterium CG10_big_fil_rev_8_21_14_0_10_36_7]